MSADTPKAKRVRKYGDPKGRQPGAAAKRAIATLPGNAKDRDETVRRAQAIVAARGPYVGNFCDCEGILEAAGIPKSRIPVLAARLRSGTTARVDYGKEVPAS